MSRVPSTPADRHGFRPDIEGLRGLAILLVVLYHVGVPGVAGGFVGVDVFFVLSGYLITGLLAAEIAATGRVNFAQFYARRVRRLLPVACLVLVVTLAAGLFVYAPLEQRNLTGSARAAAMYLGNVQFARQSLDYYADDTATNPFLHTWSLAVEEQFYVLWPLFTAFALSGLMWRRTAGLTDGRLGHTRDRRRAVWCIAGIAAVSVTASLWLTRMAPPWAFFGLPTRVWEFALGALAAVHVGRRGLSSTAANVLAWAGVLAVLGATLAYDGKTPYPGVAAALPVLGAVALVVSGEVRGAGVVQWWFGTPPMRWLGKLSYSWYLWHWPVLVLANAATGPLSGAVRAGLAVVALLLSAVTYRLLENPVRQSPWLAARPAVSIALGLVLTLGTVSAATAVRIAGERLATTPAQRGFSRAARDEVRPMLRRAGCRIDHADGPTIGCSFGDSASPRTVVLFGDSHAEHWLPALARVGAQRQWRLVVFIKPGCPIPTGVERVSYVQYPAACDRWRREAVDRIRVLRPSAVFIANASNYYLEQPGTALGITRAGVEKAWADGLERTLSVLDGQGVRSIIIRDTPQLRFSAPACLARASWASWRPIRPWCRAARDSALNADAERAEQQASKALQYAVVVDLNDELCDTASCAAMRDRTVMYRDDDHLTATFSAGLAPALSERLDAIARADSRFRTLVRPTGDWVALLGETPAAGAPTQEDAGTLP
jgi:peptidoglycan/LPS O-acetylase OafA/YrhL